MVAVRGGGIEKYSPDPNDRSVFGIRNSVKNADFGESGAQEKSEEPQLLWGRIERP